MDPRLLLQLSEIVECGSLRRAAEKLNVTQPTLSRNMKILEDRVGTPVLRRLSHGVEPTPLGQRLVEKGQDILSTCALANIAVDQWHMGLEKEVVLGVGSMVAVSIMRDFFAENLIDPLPYAVRSLTMPPERLIYRVEDGELDAAIGPVTFDRQYGSLHHIALLEDQLVIFAGPENELFNHQGILEPSDLAGQTWVLAGPAENSEALRSVLADYGVHDWLAPYQFMGDVTMALQTVARTRALVVLPRFQAGLSFGGEKLRELRTPFELPKLNLALWMRDKNRDRPIMLDLTERLRSYVRNLPKRAKAR